MTSTLVSSRYQQANFSQQKATGYMQVKVLFRFSDYFYFKTWKLTPNNSFCLLMRQSFFHYLSTRKLYAVLSKLAQVLLPKWWDATSNASACGHCIDCFQNIIKSWKSLRFIVNFFYVALIPRAAALSEDIILSLRITLQAFQILSYVLFFRACRFEQTFSITLNSLVPFC